MSLSSNSSKIHLESTHPYSVYLRLIFHPFWFTYLFRILQQNLEFTFNLNKCLIFKIYNYIKLLFFNTISGKELQKSSSLYYYIFYPNISFLYIILINSLIVETKLWQWSYNQARMPLTFSNDLMNSIWSWFSLWYPCLHIMRTGLKIISYYLNMNNYAVRLDWIIF